MQKLIESFKKNLGLEFIKVNDNQYRCDCFDNDKEFLIAVSLTYSNDVIICTLSNTKNEVLTTTITSLEDFTKWLMSNQHKILHLQSLIAIIRTYKLNYILKDEDEKDNYYYQNKL